MGACLYTDSNSPVVKEYIDEAKALEKGRVNNTMNTGGRVVGFL